MTIKNEAKLYASQGGGKGGKGGRVKRERRKNHHPGDAQRARCLEAYKQKNKCIKKGITKNWVQGAQTPKSASLQGTSPKRSFHLHLRGEKVSRDARLADGKGGI